MRTRPLFLTTESARHPFRKTLPCHVLSIVDPEEKRDVKEVQSDDNDWKLFVLSFCAFFTAFYSFIY